MITLHARLGKRCDAEPFIARVARGSAAGLPNAEHEALFVDQREALIPGYRAYLVSDGFNESLTSANPDIWPIPESLHHLSDGDIIRISPRSGELWVMYRRESAFNSMLLTEQCNSYCLMCSQPPKSGDDGTSSGPTSTPFRSCPPRRASWGSRAANRRSWVRNSGSHPEVQGVPAGDRAAHALERQALQLPDALPRDRGDRSSGPDGWHPALFGHRASPRFRRAGRRSV